MTSLETVFAAVNAAAVGRAPVLVGIAGAVAVGKTTIAAIVAEKTFARVLSTDRFLLSNDELARHDLLMRKGFPESYDRMAISEVLGRLRRGASADVRVYSHATYDLIPDVTDRVEPTDVIVVEGVIALQPEVLDHLDLAIYIDAPEDAVRRWFVDRFLLFVDEGRSDAASFYHGFAQLDRHQVIAIAEATWDGINAVNLREHIAPTKGAAHLVIEKGSDHRVLGVSRVGE